MPPEWQVATRKGKSKGAQQTVQPLPYTSENADLSGFGWKTQDLDHRSFNPRVASTIAGDPLARLQQQMSFRSKELQHSSFLGSFQRLWAYVESQCLLDCSPKTHKHEELFAWKTATELVIYGLGSPATGARPVHSQLAFALLLQTQLPSLQQTCAFDPVFSNLDRALLSHYQVKVLEQNDSGSFVATGPTLFYMPHCDCHLYNNLLKANWGPDQLRKIAVLGNSFHSYTQRWAHASKKHSVDKPHELLAVSTSGTAIELPVSEADFPVTSAFNDLSLHLFPEWKVCERHTLSSSASSAQIKC